jgi:hypothetical protein
LKKDRQEYLNLKYLNSLEDVEMMERNQQNDEYVACDVEFEECVVDGKTMYKCFRCEKMFIKTELLSDHYIFEHTLLKSGFQKEKSETFVAPHDTLDIAGHEEKMPKKGPDIQKNSNSGKWCSICSYVFWKHVARVHEGKTPESYEDSQLDSENNESKIIHRRQFRKKPIKKHTK